MILILASTYEQDLVFFQAKQNGGNPRKENQDSAGIWTQDILTFSQALLLLSCWNHSASKALDTEYP